MLLLLSGKYHVIVCYQCKLRHVQHWCVSCQNVINVAGFFIQIQANKTLEIVSLRCSVSALIGGDQSLSKARGIQPDHLIRERKRGLEAGLHH